MTQENKQLVLVDLCARMPYEVEVAFQVANYTPDIRIFTGKDYDYLKFNHFIDEFTKCTFKPYLRPMSSMTEEEKREFQSFFPGSFGNQWLNVEEGYIDIYECEPTTRLYLYDAARLIEWLNKKMFDYRGLIPEGLAISTEEFNPYK